MTPEQIAYAGAQTIQGKNACEIARTIGCHNSTVSRHLADIRDKIEAEVSELIQRGLKPARRTLTRLAAEGNKSTDKDMLSLSLKASQSIFQYAGAGAGSPSTIINALIQVNQSEIPPQLADVIQGLANRDIVDIEDSDA